jgi:hypothetical protein
MEENIRLAKLSEEDMLAINDAHLKIGKLRLADNIKSCITTDDQGSTLFMGWTYAEIGWTDEKGTWLT